MFYLFRNSSCYCLCEDEKRLDDMKEEDDIILEHERWLNPANLALSSDGKSIVIKKIIQTAAEIKAQNFASCNEKYTALLANIAAAIQQTFSRGDDIAVLQKKYNDMREEWKTALLDIQNKVEA